MTFTGGLRHNGMTAPRVPDGPMDGPAFITCIKARLAPILDEGDVVVPDNLPAHRVAAALAAIRERGAWLLFLPPCSPDLNPTGPAFPQPKAHMKRLALGTVGDLWNGAGAILELFSRQECADLFSATGYGANQNGNALVENYFAKIKEFRGIATRYDKTDCSYAANWNLAAALIASR